MSSLKSSIYISLYLKKEFISHKYGFYFIFRDFVVMLQCLVSCCLVMTFCFLSSYYNVLFDCSVLFICERFKWINHIRSDKDNKLDFGCKYVVKLES